MAILFVLGAPRSGTTLLSGLLEQTQYGVPYETQFIPKFFDKLVDYKDLSLRQNFTDIANDILKQRSMQRFVKGFDINKAFDELSPNITYASLVDYLCALQRGETHLSWGDKTPWYLSRLDCMVGLFPTAKFIFIHRDGRDVALSLLQKKWGPNNIYSCARYWKDLHDKQAELRAKLEHNGQLISISYEALLHEPVPIVNSLYRFLGENVEQSVVTSLCVNIRSDNANKWQSKMSQSQIRVFDSVAGTTLKSFGYHAASHTKPISTFYKLCYSFHEYIKIAIYLFELNVIDGLKIKFFGKQPFHE